MSAEEETQFIFNGLRQRCWDLGRNQWPRCLQAGEIVVGTRKAEAGAGGRAGGRTGGQRLLYALEE